MTEYNFKVTTKDTGWIGVVAESREEAFKKLKATYSDKSDLVEDRQWVEGEFDSLELQTSDGFIKLTF